ncbi:MAG: hypothetical protein WBA88_17880 [Pseudaminobacter sp.]
MDCDDKPAIGNTPEGLQPCVYGSYRPGELRLYGCPSPPTPAPASINQGKLDELNAAWEEIPPEATSLERQMAKIKTLLQEVFASPGEDEGDIIRFSVTQREPARRSLGNARVEYALTISEPGEISPLRSIGVIYGYAYEGHCYRLPKPRIMVLPVEPCELVIGDCGYDPELGYAVWRLDKLERVVALDVRTDSLKTLLLDENMPGNRSPLAYAQALNLAPHRGRE